MSKLYPLCVYHKADLDGISSAAITYNYFNKKCELYGMDHGEEFPWDLAKNRTVYFVDFSIPVKYLQKLSQICNLYIIDHHKTLIDDLEKNSLTHIKGLRSTEFAGCELTWKFFNKTNIPRAINYLGIFDSWRNEDKNIWNRVIVPFEFGCLSISELQDPKSELWLLFFNNGDNKDLSSIINGSDKFINSVIDRGLYILEYKKLNDSKTCSKSAFKFNSKINGKVYRLICINSSGTGSQTFESIYDPDKYDIMCSFYMNKEQKWCYSFYSDKDEIDCGQLAKNIAKSNGGGHKGAAGFQLDFLLFNKLH